MFRLIKNATIHLIITFSDAMCSVLFKNTTIQSRDAFNDAKMQRFILMDWGGTLECFEVSLLG